MEESFKIDTSLLVTECLVRAVEIRMQGTSKTPEALRADAIEKSMEQGFILTRFFYEFLAQFEKDPEGIRNAYIDLLNAVDVKKEEKRAAETHFAAEAVPDVLHFARPKDQHLLLLAEKRLMGGDLKTAQELAEQSLHDGHEDAGRALFILAQIATAKRDMAGATGYFEEALKVAQEPKVIAWSHIYLGRIFDLQERRENALDRISRCVDGRGHVARKSRRRRSVVCRSRTNHPRAVSSRTRIEHFDSRKRESAPKERA